MRYTKFFLLVLVAALIGCGDTAEETTKVEKPNQKMDASKVEVKEATPAPEETTLTAAKSEPAFEFTHATFESPVMLMAGGKPMKAGHSYPSPAIIDIDNDGDLEMVLGEIFGTVSVCENENSGDGDPVWGKVTPLKMADGKPLKLNNW